MENPLQLILTACVVNFGLTFVRTHYQTANQAIVRNVNDESEIQKNFKTLFNSISINDSRMSETHRAILKHEVAREQQVFDVMKEELRVARDRNFNKKRNLYRKSKRETHENKRCAGRPRTYDPYDDMSSVTSLIGSETIFLDLRRLRAPTNFDIEEVVENRRGACESILTGGFFKEECALTTIPDDVKAAHLEQLRALNGSLEPYAYVWRDITFHSRIVQEYVYSCFAWSDRTNSVVEYLLSREYNWNWDIRSHMRVVALLHGHGRPANETVGKLIALGERPPRVSFDFNELEEDNEWDKKYSDIYVRQGYENDDEDDSDLLTEEPTTTSAPFTMDDGYDGQGMCDTTREQRVRLCSGMLHSEAYRDKIRYSPYKDDGYSLKSPHSCKKLDLHFTQKKQLVLTKWVVECEAVELATMKPVVFGIAIGVESQLFFVARLYVGNRSDIVAHFEFFWP